MMGKRTAGRRDGQPAACAAPACVAVEPVREAIVSVRDEWNGWRTATVRVADLEDIHWSQPPGAWRPIVHAAVWCNRLQSGRIPHECDPARAPHKLTVCVLKSHAQPAVFAELATRAARAPQSLEAGS